MMWRVVWYYCKGIYFFTKKEGMVGFYVFVSLSYIKIGSQPLGWLPKRTLDKLLNLCEYKSLPYGQDKTCTKVLK